MGNEASIPENGASHDDGLLPPSQIPPEEANNAASRTGKIKAMFQPKGTDFRDQEMARAAAEGGHLMPYSSTSPPQQQQQPQHYGQQQQKAYYDPSMVQSQQQFKSKDSTQKQQYVANASTPLQPASDSAPVVGVMYASEGRGSTMASAAAATAASSLRSGGKAMRNSGRALLNSMKNLSIRTKSPNNKDESEWETRWDEDDESDGEEDESTDVQEKEDVKMPASETTSLASASTGPLHTSGEAVSPVNSMAPPAPPISKSYPIQPTATVAQKPPAAASDSQSSTFSKQQPADSIGWDTGTATGPATPALVQESTYEKPNVQMFLPLLRVLGKGSFGKVRPLWLRRSPI